jgi:hypothetical protein
VFLFGLEGGRAFRHEWLGLVLPVCEKHVLEVFRDRRASNDHTSVAVELNAIGREVSWVSAAAAGSFARTR